MIPFVPCCNQTPEKMRYTIVAIGLALSLMGCAASEGAANADAADRTTLEVLNNNFYDMNVFVLWSGQRVRLGNVMSGATRRFTLPAYVVDAGATLRFQADPIGGTTAPITQLMDVHPGDKVSLVIPSF